jgi:hypothetical protein
MEIERERKRKSERYIRVEQQTIEIIQYLPRKLGELHSLFSSSGSPVVLSSERLE